MYLVGLVMLLAATEVHGWPSGAPPIACANMTPSADTNGGHGATPNTDVNFPYQVTMSKACFVEGETVNGKLSFSG